MNQDKKTKIEKLIEENSFSGVVSVTMNKEIIYNAAGGYRDIPNKLDNNLSTRFALASGAKTFTAVAILLLQEQGKLHIGDPIANYLDEEFSNYDKQVTIQHLLSHTSGIPDYLDEEKEEDLSRIPWSKLLKPKDYFPYFPKTEMDFAPGTKFKYNNGAFVLLSHIIDKITGDFYYFVNGYLEKAKLHNTGYYSFDKLPENTANGYVFSDNDEYKSNIYDLPIIGSGDGGIFSTVNDLSLFWNKLFNFEILSKDSVELFTKQMVMANPTSYYGLGVWIKKTANAHRIGMVGQDQGVSFTSTYNMRTKEVVTIIANNDSDAWKVLRIIEE